MSWVEMIRIHPRVYLFTATMWIQMCRAYIRPTSLPGTLPFWKILYMQSTRAMYIYGCCEWYPCVFSYITNSHIWMQHAISRFYPLFGLFKFFCQWWLHIQKLCCCHHGEGKSLFICKRHFIYLLSSKTTLWKVFEQFISSLVKTVRVGMIWI